MLLILLSLALLLIFSDQTRSSTTIYNIATSANTCGNTNGNCQTLDQFAAGSSSVPNITLILHDGNHSLPRDWSITYQNSVTVTVHPNSSAAVINCEGSPLIRISNTTDIHIHNILFVGCRMNVSNVFRGLTISNSMFIGQDIMESALVLNSVERAEIDSCIFTSNKVGTAIGRTLPPYDVQSIVGGAIFATNCNINVSQSRFESNSAGFGGAIFTQSQSSIAIVNSTFISNTANANLVYGSGSALYDYRGHVDIHACIFSSNVASGSGGALYFYESAARVTSCNFRNNKQLLF